MKKRSEVPLEDCWNVEAIYPDTESWRKDFNSLKKEGKLYLESILRFKGRLGQSPETLKMLIEAQQVIERKLVNLYVYMHLKHDEDIAEETYKTPYGEIQAALFDFQKQTSWIEPELIELSEETQKIYLESKPLQPYRFQLEKTFRLKEHTLSSDKEELVALASKALRTPGSAFSALNDADLKFPDVEDSNGEKHALSHGSYQVMLRSFDRKLRENAFKTYMGRYDAFDNTMAELIQGAVQANIFQAKAHKFNSALDAALFPKNIDTQVYRSLIDTVRNRIGALHDYYKVRKKALGVEKLHLWDQSVPITPELEIRMEYPEAEKVIIESMKPLGDDYVKKLEEGLKNARWVDRYENKNKRSGAYSSGSYDTQPYILMNYKGILRDVFTLAHEAGHSMHSLYSKTQPYQYYGYPIFLAEVASTFNEELLSVYLRENAKSTDEKIFLINQKLEDIKATLFRQVMFAEFELLIHEHAEKDLPITPAFLKTKYKELCDFYFGEDVVVDPEIDIEWARIPHFYYNFYVYQYATGISAALALSEKVLKGDKKDRDAYLNFLKSGCSKYPIDTLKLAGVDMATPDPVASAIDLFAALTQELNALL